MKKQFVLLAALLTIGSQVAEADSRSAELRNGRSAATVGGQKNHAEDRIGPSLIAGKFQRHEEGRRIIRISDVDYDLDPILANSGVNFREFRYGQTVLFVLGGVSEAGRNVITSIEPQ